MFWEWQEVSSGKWMDKSRSQILIISCIWMAFTNDVYVYFTWNIKAIIITVPLIFLIGQIIFV